MDEVGPVAPCDSTPPWATQVGDMDRSALCPTTTQAGRGFSRSSWSPRGAARLVHDQDGNRGDQVEN